MGGVRLACVDHGRGAPIVFVHGLVASQGYWRYNVPAIAESMRALALDLPGYGRSDKPDLSYTPACLADWLERFLEARGVERATVVGNSMGGLVAMALAAAYPRRVGRLVLVNAAGIGSRWRAALRGPAGLAMRGFHARRPPERLYGTIFRLAFPGRPDLAEFFTRQYIVGARTAEYELFLRSTARTIRGVLDYPVERVAATLRLPTLVLWGERDRLLPLRVARRLHGLIPGAELITYPESGHCPMLDQPERFNADVLRFACG